MPHLLKKLELNGFKSFAGKTTLEFTAGITAVVGPNGSGKSNIVDAIRWLLGERDARNLRGGNVEDLIFAGTPKRPRTGQAQASLYFENQHNYFPVDFAEIVVTRQVTRDGESRYFLNKAEVLLRDLVDFFAKARLGARGLVVVTQGNSDMFITATPLERREMIEEILGLREYQIKKADALRRLKASRVNLDKVKALVDELLPHLRSLKRQTSRWEKRGQVQEELETLEKKFFGSQWSRLHKEISDVTGRIAEHQKFQHALDEAQKVAEAHQLKIEAGQPKEREELLKFKRELSELYAKRGTMEKRIGRLEASIEGEQHRASPIDGPNVQEFFALLQDIRRDLHELAHMDLEETRESIKELISRIATFLVEKKEKNTKPKGGSEFAEELRVASRELKELDITMHELKKREDALERGQQEFMEVFKKAVAGVESAKRAVEEWEEGERKLELELERLEMRLGELKHQITQAGHEEGKFAHVSGISLEHENLPSMEGRMFRLRGELASIGDIDEALVKEARETEERYAFLEREGKDLGHAIDDLKNLIQELREKIHVEFAKALGKINGEFEKFFMLMFGAGGHAKLKIESSVKRQVSGEDSENGEMGKVEKEEVTEDKDEELGVEIQLSLPKKRLESLEVLSGGEKSLVGIAALFALISVSPPPFLVLDEIDAPLDERNARRFAEMLREFSKETQFIVVTHNRATMEAADVLYGVTLDEDGTSKVFSMKFEKTLEPEAVKK
jgi:chromosome segregation ATPase